MHAKLLGYCFVVAIVGLSSIGAARATTYDVSGTFADGGTISGFIEIDNGALLSVDISSNALPGDGATHWGGAILCDQASCGPSLASYEYVIFSGGTEIINETYNASTLTYDFNFNGLGDLAYLDLVFTLDPSGDFGTITAGHVFDPACGGSFCTFIANGVSYTYGGGVDLTSGTLSTAPIPAALPLFATGLGALGLFGWRRKRKNAAAQPNA